MYAVALVIPEFSKKQSFENNLHQKRMMQTLIRLHLLLAYLFFPLLAGCSMESNIDFKKGDRIAIIGNALADRMQHDGWLESYIQATHPDHNLVIRNLGFTGDQVHRRPRAHANFGDSDYHLAHAEADWVFAYFGYNESFDDRPEEFRAHLLSWIEHTRTQQYNGDSAPQIVLFSPIAHENLNNPNLPDGTDNNRRLLAYTEVMRETADQTGVYFVDLFSASQSLYDNHEIPLTINGVHLSEEGNRQIARFIVEDLFGRLPRSVNDQFEGVRQAVLDKNRHWFNRYRATSGNDVWGGRAELHGNRETLQHELLMLDVMTANRDTVIWAAAKGEQLSPDDTHVPPPLPVETNFDRDVVYLGGEEALEKMTLAEGLEMNLFASEEMFPELINPVQLQVDTKGRLWVAAWSTYPKWEPLKEMTDRLMILEDTDGDGKADKSTTFANIHNPTGFEFWNDGVIVVSAPDILFLKDTTGDDKADVQIRLMGAIDSADTHHTANNVVYGPDGYIYYQRGVFHLNNVETPWRRNMESDVSGLYRFNPRTFEFDFVVENIYNPHGISFDKWGNQFITDGTMGTAHQVYLDGDRFEKRPLLNHTVRPVPGNQVLSTSQFPEEFRDNFLIYNVIGFLGAKRYELSYDEGTVWGEEIGDLFYSDDPNFRPTDGVIGNDGALYVSDWHNAIIGHMQHNLRDPMRDHTHGRIYRIVAKDRPLMKPVPIFGEPVEHLLELLKHPDNEIRHRVRIELSGRETDEVISSVQNWINQFDPENEVDALHLLEALWVHQQHNVQNHELLEMILNSPVENARYAAEKVRWFWEDHEPQLISGHLAAETETPGSDSFDRSGLEIDLTSEETAEITIKTIIEQMRFDVARFTVRSRQPVRLNVENPDFMPHNLVITEPGAADDVYEMAIDLGSRGFELHFIPENPKILESTQLLRHNESELLEFNAPEIPGRYQFICTFPGHGIMMRGIMEVVE
jgi:azurin/glucose/arabinose dehydrogenase/lysophospholipase L1-like esterase